jgi:hypothetical protein
MYYGLDALLHGAVAVLVALMPAIALFWWLTPTLRGARPVRPFVAACAAYGVAVGAAGLWAGNVERASFVDEAMTGAMIGGAILALAAFLILLLVPRKA